MGKVLVFDLEAAIKTTRVGKRDRVDGRRSYIFSIQWSELTDKKVYSKDITEFKSFKKNFMDDKELCVFIVELLSDPEVVGWITQNGSDFDIPLINTRCLINGVPTLPLKNHADTLKMARGGRGKILLGSYSLDNMTKTFGLSEKGKVPELVWDKARVGDKKSIKEIVAYGRDDIPATKDLYNVLSKTTAIGLVDAGVKPPAKPKWDGLKCVNCQGTKFRNKGTEMRASGKQMRDLRCKSCGKLHYIEV